MLYVYGPLMPLRLLEEIRFWKMQEKEHTVVIRTLVPTLETVYAKVLKEWEAVFEKTEMTAQQWIEWAIRTQMPTDPHLQHQLGAIVQSSMEQSKQFIEQLLLMEQQSVPVSTNPVVKTVIEHIIRESEYFLGVLQGLGANPIDPMAQPQVQPPYAPPMAEEPMFRPYSPTDPSAAPSSAGFDSLSDANNQAFIQSTPEAFRDIRFQPQPQVEPLDESVVDTRASKEAHKQMTATGESTWSNPVPAQEAVPIGGHKLPPLPYAYDALEPYIDAATMKLHHDKHHQSYVDGLNKAEKMLAKERESGDFSLVKHWERELAFNGAGHYLHTIFWNIMKPKGGGKANGPIAAEINSSFGSFDDFKKHFSAAAEKVEGGGWTILVWSPRSHRLEILQAEKHQNLSQWDVIPLLPLDVWEHSYYLKYQAERPKYIEAWWNVINWDDVNERFTKARQLRWMPY